MKAAITALASLRVSKSCDLGLELPCFCTASPCRAAHRDPSRFALPKPPQWVRTHLRTGSRAAHRSPILATCRPTRSDAQWSTAAKNQHQPSAFVEGRDVVRARSSSGLLVRIGPLWVRSPRVVPAASAPAARTLTSASAAGSPAPGSRRPQAVPSRSGGGNQRATRSAGRSAGHSLRLKDQPGDNYLPALASCPVSVLRIRTLTAPLDDRPHLR